LMYPSAKQRCQIFQHIKLTAHRFDLYTKSTKTRNLKRKRR
jgi:hypothetical protein